MRRAVGEPVVLGGCAHWDGRLGGQDGEGRDGRGRQRDDEGKLLGEDLLDVLDVDGGRKVELVTPFAARGQSLRRTRVHSRFERCLRGILSEDRAVSVETERVESLEADLAGAVPVAVASGVRVRPLLAKAPRLTRAPPPRRAEAVPAPVADEAGFADLGARTPPQDLPRRRHDERRVGRKRFAVGRGGERVVRKGRREMRTFSGS